MGQQESLSTITAYSQSAIALLQWHRDCGVNEIIGEAPLFLQGEIQTFSTQANAVLTRQMPDAKRNTVNIAQQNASAYLEQGGTITSSAQMDGQNTASDDSMKQAAISQLCPRV